MRRTNGDNRRDRLMVFGDSSLTELGREGVLGGIEGGSTGVFPLVQQSRTWRKEEEEINCWRAITLGGRKWVLFKYRSFAFVLIHFFVFFCYCCFFSYTVFFFLSILSNDPYFLSLYLSTTYPFIPLYTYLFFRLPIH